MDARRERFRSKRERPSERQPHFSDIRTQSLKHLKDNWVGDVVYGASPVLAALKANRRAIHALYIQEGADGTNKKNDKVWREVISLVEKLSSPIHRVDKHTLNMLSENRPHQGMVLDADPLRFEPLDVFPMASDVWGSVDASKGKTPPLWLCLDEVADPQNFGAILRSAYFLGAAGVVTCERNSAPLSGVVSKASAGAMEMMSIHSARNLPRTLESAQSQGWTVFGAASGSDTVSCRDLKLQGPSVLVVGNEGRGLRTTVRQKCDALIRVDSAIGNPLHARGHGECEIVDSLNVSVATAILLYQLLSIPRQKCQ